MMLDHDVRVSPSEAGPKREDQLAWRIAAVGADELAVTTEVATVIGAGALRGLQQDIIYQAEQQVPVSFTGRESRSGDIRSWQAYAPARSGKRAIEAVDRAMRLEDAPGPIYEGEDSVIALILNGPQAHLVLPLPAAGEPGCAIPGSYSRERGGDYQSQAVIDPAYRMRDRKIETTEDPEWTRSHRAIDPIGRSFGGRVEIFLRYEQKLADEITVASARPLGTGPFRRGDCVNKFQILTDGIKSTRESNRFLEAAQELRRLPAGDSPLGRRSSGRRAGSGQARDFLEQEECFI